MAHLAARATRRAGTGRVLGARRAAADVASECCVSLTRKSGEGRWERGARRVEWLADAVGRARGLGLEDIGGGVHVELHRGGVENARHINQNAWQNTTWQSRVS